MAPLVSNTTAPLFALPDYNGTMVSLSDFRDRNHVLVVFNRGFF